jgi:hypothetical protein
MNTGYARILFPFSLSAAIACGLLPAQAHDISRIEIYPVPTVTLPIYNVQATNGVGTDIEIRAKLFNKESGNRA